MDPEEILSLIDSLELDEDYIDKLLQKLLNRSKLTTRQIKNALRFLKYKLAVNKQEKLECQNEREYDLVAKLIKDVDTENVELVCEVTSVVLQLNTNSMISKAEHFLQQILSEMKIPSFQGSHGGNSEETPEALLELKLCSSILDALINQQKTVLMPFLQVPLENMIFSSNEEVLNFFYSHTVPDFKNGVIGFSILTRIWACLKNMEFRQIALRAIGSLADYYLPLPEESDIEHNKYSVAAEEEFWETMLFGLQSSDSTVRKRAKFLIKRALESLAGSDKNININTEELVMVWDQKNEKMIKTMWDNFFILMDSLEETQSNLVLPSLKIFEAVKHLGHCWLNCAYNIGLQHDNASVRLNCIKYRLEMKIESKAEAFVLLNALNDINLYENPLDTKELTTNVGKALEDKHSIINILEAIPSVKWSPVPLYYLAETLGEVVLPTFILKPENKKICTIINDILRIPVNSPVLKKVIFSHISNFIVNSCKGLTWEDYVAIYPNLHSETPINSYIMNAFAAHIKKNLYLSDTDKEGFAEAMIATGENINIALLYVGAHEQEGIPYFLSLIKKSVENIMDITTSPFASRIDCLGDVHFLINVFTNTVGRSEPYMVFINGAVTKHYSVILEYISCWMGSTTSFNIEDTIALSDRLDQLNTMLVSDTSTEPLLLQLYKTSVALLNDSGSPLDKKTFSMSVMNFLLHNELLYKNNQNEMLSLEQFLAMVMNIRKNMPMHGSGRLIDLIYEKSCDIVLSHLNEDVKSKDVIDVFEFVSDVLECGGYGCVKFILRIINKILPKLIDNEGVAFDLLLFLNKMWTQICELKTSREYVVCVDEYVKLITRDQLLTHPQHNNVVVSHYATIIDFVVTKRMPLYFLVKHLCDRNVMLYENMGKILSDIILYAIVPKKDQRITENLIVELFPKMQGIIMPDAQIFSQHIQFLSIIMLSKVTGVGHLNEIADRLMSEIDQLLKIKPRYYPNNTTHRKLFRALQALLFIFLKTRQVDVKKTAFWCMNLLKTPHDATVKICLLWYIAMYIYSSDITIDGDLVSCLSQNGVPLVSQFTIAYYVMRHKISARIHFTSETEFVLDFLLANTMGPVFSTRLIAQYYAMMLMETGTIRKKINMERYNSVIAILDKTLGDLIASKDNSFNTLRSDYFIQTFDIVGDLTLMFIFHSMQRRVDQCTENIDSPFAVKIFSEIEDTLAVGDADSFFVEWKGIRRWHAVTHYQGLTPGGQMEAKDESSLLQKKYTPWSSICDYEMDDSRRSTKNLTDLIVVATLVNRPTNLGGLTRTCEVFGVNTLIIDTLRHVQDKQFQSLSVSADRWVNMEEVHAGRSLKEYLVKKKKEGYSIVAAEQTFNSRDLTEFRFPKKSIIMLGHEKEGIPPNLLPLMDHCIEIPQQGVIRSLNVHVTASIFVWEYNRQFSTPSASIYLK